MSKALLGLVLLLIVCLAFTPQQAFGVSTTPKRVFYIATSGASPPSQASPGTLAFLSPSGTCPSCIINMTSASLRPSDHIVVGRLDRKRLCSYELPSASYGGVQLSSSWSSWLDQCSSEFHPTDLPRIYKRQYHSQRPRNTSHRTDLDRHRALRDLRSEKRNHCIELGLKLCSISSRHPNVRLRNPVSSKHYNYSG